MVWIKICGITNTDDAEAASRYGADALGFVFSTDSPRKVDLDTAYKLIGHLKDFESVKKTTDKVGVFVNEDLEFIEDFSKRLKLDYIQLSGDESKDYIKKLKKMIPGTKVIKAIRLEQEAVSIKNKQVILNGFELIADNILIDSYDPRKYGGTGKTLDLDIVASFSSLPGLILSGGLDHLNIYKAVRSVRPFGIDTSSKLEISPGKKDSQLIRKFIMAARSAEG